MAVHNVSLALEAMRFFRLEGSQRPVILKPGETKDLIEMSLTPEALEDKILNSYLTIHTNISSINLHLICYHGMVKTVSIAYFCDLFIFHHIRDHAMDINFRIYWTIKYVVHVKIGYF